ncbi:MAG: ATP-binding cassette domain-containing protein [Bacilli bacterium]|nr:ATP-binding cassette domain-containing protein [Bacilli bacterium]
MLKVEHVTKKYGDLVAVNDLSFEVKDGEIFGLLGLNGAGKTTTFRMILGLLDDYDGTITIDGKKINYEITDKIGFLTEERSLLTKLTVYEQIVYYGVLKSMTEEDIDKKLDHWLEKFGIKEYKHKKIKELSKGNQQKIQFISAIINEPKLLILDEPFSGLDPINVELFKEVILDLKKKGTSIIFSSHRMEHVELFCEKLVVLVKGKSVINGYLSDIKKEYKKKNIIVSGDIDENIVNKQKGVNDIKKVNKEYIISIEDDSYINSLFKCISKFENIVKFSVEDPSLNEIFISIVGDSYDK